MKARVHAEMQAPQVCSGVGLAQARRKERDVE